MTTEDQELAALWAKTPPRSPERLLREAAGAVRALGLEFAGGEYLSPDETKCCALGAVAYVCRKGGGIYGDTHALVEQVLAIDMHQRCALAIGFDGEPVPRNGSDAQWHALGARLRRELLGAPVPAGQGPL